MTSRANIASLKWCEKCDRTGSLVLDDSALHEGSGFEVECPHCDGTGVRIVEGFPPAYTAVDEAGEVVYDS
jgi:DnaJ-class molecular chaperone